MELLKELTGHKTQTMEEAQRQRKIERARYNFWEYCLLMNPDFFKRHRQYQKTICDTMQALYEHELISPNTGKPYDLSLIHIFIKGKNLNLANWLVVEQTKEQLTIMHRHTGKLREIRLQ